MEMVLGAERMIELVGGPADGEIVRVRRAALGELLRVRWRRAAGWSSIPVDVLYRVGCEDTGALIAVYEGDEPLYRIVYD